MFLSEEYFDSLKSISRLSTEPSLSDPSDDSESEQDCRVSRDIGRVETTQALQIFFIKIRLFIFFVLFLMNN